MTPAEQKKRVAVELQKAGPCQRIQSGRADIRRHVAETVHLGNREPQTRQGSELCFDPTERFDDSWVVHAQMVRVGCNSGVSDNATARKF